MVPDLAQVALLPLKYPRCTVATTPTMSQTTTSAITVRGSWPLDVTERGAMVATSSAGDRRQRDRPNPPGTGRLPRGAPRGRASTRSGGVRARASSVQPCRRRVARTRRPATWLAQCLLEIGEQVVDIFDADGEPHQ